MKKYLLIFGGLLIITVLSIESGYLKNFQKIDTTRDILPNSISNNDLKNNSTSSVNEQTESREYSSKGCSDIGGKVINTEGDTEEGGSDYCGDGWNIIGPVSGLKCPCACCAKENKEFVKLDPIGIEKFVADTSDWQTYKNDKFGFEFKYPNNMKIVFDDTVMVNPNGNSWYRLSLGDKNNSQRPNLLFEIDTIDEAYGPLPEKRYELSEKEGGGFNVVSVANLENKSTSEHSIQIDANYSKNNKSYWWKLSFIDDEISNELIFREILMTFKI